MTKKKDKIACTKYIYLCNCNHENNVKEALSTKKISDFSSRRHVQRPYQLCKQSVYDLFGQEQHSQEEEAQLQSVAHESSIYDS